MAWQMLSLDLLDDLFHIRRKLSGRFAWRAWALCAVWLAVCTSAVAAPESVGPHLWIPANHLSARQLAVVINEGDPLSVRIGRYYERRRAIPKANVIHVDFRADRDVMPVAEFNRVYARVKRLTPPGVQAFALTWRRPYRVACMSKTD